MAEKSQASEASHLKDESQPCQTGGAGEGEGSGSADAAPGNSERQKDLRTMMQPAYQLYRRAFPVAPEGERADAVPQSAGATLTAVAGSLKRACEGMGPWGVGDLTLGLYKLAQRHAAEGVEDSIAGDPVVDKRELVALLHWFECAFAAYQKDVTSLASALAVPKEQIIKFVPTSSIHRPSYYIAVDHAWKSVVLCVRGTRAATDVLTDLTSASEPFHTAGDGPGGFAHHGMLESARWLADTESPALANLLRRWQGYELKLVGHSLGAGTAALSAMVLRGWGGGKSTQERLGVSAERISCVAFATPPVVSYELALAAHPFISSVVLQDDVIPRASPASLEELRTEILETDWSHVLKEGELKTRLVAAWQNSVKALTPHVQSLEKATGLKEGALADASAALAKVVTYGGVVRAVGPSGAKLASGWGRLSAAVAAASAIGGAVMNAAAAHSAASAAPSGAEAGPGQTAAAAAVVATTVGTKMSREEALRRRLYAPGLQYHVIRRPLQGPEAEKKRSSAPVAAPSADVALATAESPPEAGGDVAGDAGEGLGKGRDKVKHTVLKGSDLSARFKKIVLTNTMLADHSCPAYREGLKDAMRYCGT